MNEHAAENDAGVAGARRGNEQAAALREAAAEIRKQPPGEPECREDIAYYDGHMAAARVVDEMAAAFDGSMSNDRADDDTLARRLHGAHLGMALSFDPTGLHPCYYCKALAKLMYDEGWTRVTPPTVGGTD